MVVSKRISKLISGHGHPDRLCDRHVHRRADLPSGRTGHGRQVQGSLLTNTAQNVIKCPAVSHAILSARVSRGVRNDARVLPAREVLAAFPE